MDAVAPVNGLLKFMTSLFLDKFQISTLVFLKFVGLSVDFKAAATRQVPISVGGTSLTSETPAFKTVGVSANATCETPITKTIKLTHNLSIQLILIIKTENSSHDMRKSGEI